LKFRGSNPGMGKIFFLVQNGPNRLWGPPDSMDAYYPGVNRLAVKLTTFFQLASGFRDKWVPVTAASRVQVADGRTASDMEGSCEYIE